MSGTSASGTLTNNYRAIASCRGTVMTGPQAVAAGLINLSPNLAASTLTMNTGMAAASNTYCTQNFDNEYTALPKTERIGLLSRGTYEFSPTMSGYLEVALNRVKTFQTFTDPSFTTTGLSQTSAGLRPFAYNINFAPGVAGNPFTTRARYVGSLGDMGTRDSDIKSDTGRVVGGLVYTLGSWDFDSAIGYSRNKAESLSLNRLSLAGTSATFGVPTSVQPPVPNSTSSTYNLNDFTLNSEAVRNRMRANFPRTSTSTLEFVDTKASTEFQQIQLPGGPLGLALGAELRRESLNDRPDPAAQNGDILGQGITSTNGSRNVYSAYAELRLPVLKDLEGQLAARYDHYSDYGNSTTPKIGLKYTPISTLAFRANYGRGFRAPSLPEISPSAATFFTSVTDPEDNISRQISGVYAGNRSLKAEKSTSLNLGLVFEPVKDFSTSLDFYRIRWNNVVDSPRFQDLIDASCPNGPPCPSTPSVIRDPATNYVISILSNYENLSSRVTSGFDLDMRYGFPATSFGKFTARVSGNFITKFDEDGIDVNDSNAGNATIPKLKLGASLDWDSGPWSVTTRVNYTKGWKQQGYASTSTYFSPINDPRFQTGTLPTRTRDYYTFDLYGRYKINEKLTLSASVANVFDRTPPYDPGYSTTYFYDFSQFDVRGRLVRLNLNYKM